MRKLLIAVLAVVGLGGGAIAFMPTLLEGKLLWDCSKQPYSEACVTRMRAMGHIWSRRGDLEKARTWYAAAAQENDAAAMFHLAWVYEQAALQDFAARAREAAASVSARSADKTPRVFRKNVGERNIDLAKKWYQKSADLGFAPSMNNLGQIYLHGDGGLQDQRRAFNLFMAAAKAGNPVAQWNVAIAYAAGQGVDADMAEVKKWEVWQPAEGHMRDLDEPTLARTVLFGTTLPEAYRRNLRKSAELGLPATMRYKPGQADPSLPTFYDAASRLLDADKDKK